MQKRHRFPDWNPCVPACPSGAPKTPASPRKPIDASLLTPLARMVARARRAPVLARGLRRAPEGDRVLGAALARAHDRLADPRRRRPARHRRMVGPAPRANGKPLDPVNEWGHDVLWWLDRMVRSQRPLQEKLTLFWHDHFATRDQDTPLMLAQNRKLRQPRARHASPTLLRAVTTDPAMRLFLSLVDSDKATPNENYARELMELFTLGHRRLHRARHPRGGPRADRLQGRLARRPAAAHLLRPPSATTTGVKRCSATAGASTGRTCCASSSTIRAHAPFLVGQAVGATSSPSRCRRPRAGAWPASTVARTTASRPSCARSSTTARSTRTSTRPQMVKSPVVQLAGDAAHGRPRRSTATTGRGLLR